VTATNTLSDGSGFFPSVTGAGGGVVAAARKGRIPSAQRVYMRGRWSMRQAHVHVHGAPSGRFPAATSTPLSAAGDLMCVAAKAAS
jgi:hypothetical protein